MLTTLTRGVTADDYLHTPESVARRHLVDGDLLEEPAPECDHQRISQFLDRSLWLLVQERGLGQVWSAPCDVWLADNVCVQPDVFVISAVNRRVRIERWIYGPPDLVIEVLSPATRQFVRGRKRELYAASGVREAMRVPSAATTLAARAVHEPD